MKFSNEEIIKCSFTAKVKVLIRLLRSGNYIVISIDRDPKKEKENVNFQYNVTDTELEFYSKNLIEFKRKSESLLESAKRIINN